MCRQSVPVGVSIADHPVRQAVDCVCTSQGVGSGCSSPQVQGPAEDTPRLPNTDHLRHTRS